MNSIFQFLFSTTDLRELILSSKSIKNSLDLKVERSDQLVSQLRDLFNALTWTDLVSITPKRELAEIVLKGDNSDLGEFGQQQDVHGFCF